MTSQLPRMRKTLRSLLALSYFQTLEMAIQVKGQITDGLLPIMLVQMARTGYDVVGSAPVTINAEGFIVKPGRCRERSAASPRQEGSAGAQTHSWNCRRLPETRQFKGAKAVLFLY